MIELPGAVTRTIENALEGERAHVEPARALEGLDPETAGRLAPGSPHSVHQVLRHMIFWQEFFLELLRGNAPKAPEHAPDGWPGSVSPANAEEWSEVVARFQSGLDEAHAVAQSAALHESIAARVTTTKLEILAAIAAHNSYHLGQIVLLRRMIDAWPPPGGGDTW